MNVLIAEDDAVSRRILQLHLEKWGHQVTAAAAGEEAWRLFAEKEFSIVITDWMMPGLDGVEFIRRIRGQERSRYVFTILLTAKSEKEAATASGGGVFGFVKKLFG